MNTENEKNPIVNGKELADEAAEQVTGGLFTFTPNKNGMEYHHDDHGSTVAHTAPAVNAMTAPADQTVVRAEEVNRLISPDGTVNVTFPNGL